MNRATRERLPDERRGVVKKLDVANVRIYVRTGEYPDGRLGEVFFTLGKTSKTSEAVLRSFDLFQGLLDGAAQAVSVGLQTGVPIDSICDKWEHTRFEPSHPGVGSSPLDAVARYLRERYGARE